MLLTHSARSCKACSCQTSHSSSGDISGNMVYKPQEMMVSRLPQWKITPDVRVTYWAVGSGQAGRAAMLEPSSCEKRLLSLGTFTAYRTVLVPSSTWIVVMGQLRMHPVATVSWSPRRYGFGRHSSPRTERTCCHRSGSELSWKTTKGRKEGWADQSSTVGKYAALALFFIGL